MTVSNDLPVEYYPLDNQDDLPAAIAQLVMLYAVARFGEVVGTPAWWER